MSESKCASCGASIVWVALIPKDPDRKPKRHPLDAAPIGSALVRFGRAGESARFVDTYASHFATCPNAAKHRRGGDR